LIKDKGKFKIKHSLLSKYAGRLNMYMQKNVNLDRERTSFTKVF
jgi:hypothetical protein